MTLVNPAGQLTVPFRPARNIPSGPHPVVTPSHAAVVGGVVVGATDVGAEVAGAKEVGADVVGSADVKEVGAVVVGATGVGADVVGVEVIWHSA